MAMNFKDSPSGIIKVLFCLMIIFFSYCTTKYYIVRHAEKLNNTDTSSLTVQGMQRANDLKNLPADKNIGNIYVSKYKRTQLTARPLADELNKQMIIYSPDTTAKLADQLKRIYGSNVLVVAHTNSIPELAGLLSVDSISPIQEDDFDNIFVIEIKKILSAQADICTFQLMVLLHPEKITIKYFYFKNVLLIKLLSNGKQDIFVQSDKKEVH